MPEYLVNLITRSTKVIVIITFVSLCFAFASILFNANKNLGLNFIIRSEDFTAYYTASKIIANGEGGNLYNLNKQFTYEVKQFPKTINTHIFRQYINPPVLALLFLPFINIPLNDAYFIWLIINLIVLIYIFKIFFRDFVPKVNLKNKVSIILLIISFPPIFITLISGQISLFLLLSFLMARNEFILGSKYKAGFWLSILFFKPHYILIPLLYLIYKRETKALESFLLSGIILNVFSFLLVGFSTFGNYIQLLLSILTWQNTDTVLPSLTFSLRGFLQLIMGGNNINLVIIWWVILALFVLLLVLKIWSKKIKNKVLKTDFDWSAMIISVALVTPYASGQDISILILPAFILYFWGDKLKINKNLKDLASVYLLIGYVITVISGFFVIYFHVQILVLYLVFPLFILIHIFNKDNALAQKNN